MFHKGVSNTTSKSGVGQIALKKVMNERECNSNPNNLKLLNPPGELTALASIPGK